MSLPAYTVTVPPADIADEWLAAAKAHLRVDYADEDAFISDALRAAVEDIEAYTGRDLLTRTVQARFPGLPADNCLEIWRAPNVDIQSVELWDGAAYVAYADTPLLEAGDFPRLVFTSRPAFSSQGTLYPIRVTFTAGYGGEDDVPAALKRGALEYVAHLFNQRGDCAGEDSADAAMRRPQLPKSVRMKLGRYPEARAWRQPARPDRRARDVCYGQGDVGGHRNRTRHRAL